MFKLRIWTGFSCFDAGLASHLDRIMHKITRTTLALNGIGRCFIADKHLSAIKIISRGLVCAEHVNDSGNSDVYDVIISGGGMVGSAMTCSLGE